MICELDFASSSARSGAGCCLAGLCLPGPLERSGVIGPVLGNSKWIHCSRMNLKLLHA